MSKDRKLPFSGRNSTPNIDEHKMLKDINFRMYLEGNTKEEIVACLDPNGRPFWLNNTYYFLLTLLCLGWVIRLYLFMNTLQVNYYLKKVILS